jgi:hypothetical protein
MAESFEKHARSLEVDDGGGGPHAGLGMDPGRWVQARARIGTTRSASVSSPHLLVFTTHDAIDCASDG